MVKGGEGKLSSVKIEDTRCVDEISSPVYSDKRSDSILFNLVVDLPFGMGNTGDLGMRQFFKESKCGLVCVRCEGI